ncbi:DNA alkylation repair protein [Paenibacillus sp. PK4536]|uniref:DNA alkylation repair protein n=1 Tax=Paenibacillus TaxID=44249 RepID=UPI00235A0EDE|nr:MULTISPECIES: DNA alkylation repair protein [Paenibacillus]WIM38670.1 DNA alkylation repair protein [Paenibacillus sp. PK4536]CAJ1314654.1 DNA alkylation repair protein [Paenibacillus nuruki]
MIREQILAKVDSDYQQFSASLLPTITNILGVRIPALRIMAKQIVKDDWRIYLQQADHEYFEEVMLQGMVIGYAQMDIEERLQYMTDFVPKIDNWSVCDRFCGGLKFTSTHQQPVWEFILPYLSSEHEYEVRFAVVMLLTYYVDEYYIQDVLRHLDRVQHEGYYVKMAVAWAISICYIHLPEPTMHYLQHNQLDRFTYNKALQKITESYRIDPETKHHIRSMRRK